MATTTRRKLLADPRSGARPLPGSPGPGETTRELPAAAAGDGGSLPAAATRQRARRTGSGRRDLGLDEGQEDQETEPAPEPEPEPAPAPVKASGGSGFRPGQALGGVIVGLFVWGFAENWVAGGKSQAWAWVKAKFENNVTSSAAGTAGEVGDTSGTAALGGIAPTPSGSTPPNITGSTGQA